MHQVFGLLVLIFAAAIMVTSLAQPACAYYDSQEKEESRIAEEKKLNLRNLVEENERLKGELKAVKKETLKAQDELDELKYRLLQLKNAVMLRKKLQTELAKRTRENTVSLDKSTKPQSEEHAVEVAACRNTETEEIEVVHESVSPESPQRLPGIVDRILCRDGLNCVVKLVEQIVLRYYPANTNTLTKLDSDSDSKVEIMKPELPDVNQDLEPLRSRMKTLKSRIKSALDAKDMSRETTSEKDAPCRSSKPDVPKKLRNKILKQLRKNFNEELSRKMKELKQEMQNDSCEKKRRSVWF